MVKNKRAFVAICVCMFVAFLSSPSRAANVLSILKKQEINWNGVSIDKSPTEKFYKRRLGRGIWTDNKGLNSNGRKLVNIMKNADNYGLNVSRYLPNFPTKSDFNSTELPAIELYLSQVFLRFGHDLYVGRAPSLISDPDIVIPKKKYNVNDWLKWASRKGVAYAVKYIQPQHKQYAALKAELTKAKKGSKKAKKLATNMERWRWLPRKLGKRYVIVNQAAYELALVDNGKLIDRREVIVGKPKFQTPVFSHTIQYAEFNPTWTVPESIAQNEFLPKLKRDPKYLEKNDYKIYESWEEDAPELDAKTINWSLMKPEQLSYKIVQQPGDENALGQVKFLLPNKFDIYLHDTPARQLFKKSNRAFSHGCIRVHEPLKFAEKLFGSRTLNQSKIKTLISKETTERVDLKAPIPIHITYFTAWAEKGKVKYFDDVYGRDKQVGTILSGQ